MKKIFITTLYLVIVFIALSQSSTTNNKPAAKKPIIMVKPSVLWLKKNGYWNNINTQGKDVGVPEYEKAINENIELKIAISTINGIYNDRSYPLKSLEQTIKNINQENIEINYTKSSSGSELNEDILDKIRRVATADIELDLNWDFNNNGPSKSITFILEAIDTYSGKSIASVSGIGSPSFTSSTQILLKEAVISNLDNLNSRLQNYFNDLLENGREVTLKVAIFADSKFNLESTVEDKLSNFNGELGESIENWLIKNTINSQFSTLNATQKNMVFEQVRIPLFENNIPLDSRRFFRGLSNYLSKLEPKIESKLITKGLGQVSIIIGEK